MAFKALFFSNGLYLLYLLLAVDHAAARYLLLFPSPRWAGTMEPSNRYLLVRNRCPHPRRHPGTQGVKPRSLAPAPSPRLERVRSGGSVVEKFSVRWAKRDPRGEQTRVEPRGVPAAAFAGNEQSHGTESLQINRIVSSQENISGLIRLAVGSDEILKQIKMTHFRKGSILFQPFQLMR